jgi:hypothetical protein
VDFSRVQEALRQGCVDPWAVSVHWKSSPSAPPAPDYKGAAEATAASQRNNQITPYGNLTWSQGPGTAGRSEFQMDESGTFGRNVEIPGQEGQWTSTISLDPRVQQTLDSQLALSGQMGDLANRQAGQVAGQGPMDQSSVQQTADKAYEAMTSRLDPQWKQREQMMQTQLANQGLAPGGEAYSNASRDFNNARNDAYQQANLGAIATMPQTYQLAQAQYDQPLNRLNALRTGAQVQNPQFSGSGPATNYLGGLQSQGQYAQGLYNAEVGATNAENSNLTSAAMIAAMMF